MKALLLLIGFVAAWVLLSRFVLPRLGIPT